VFNDVRWMKIQALIFYSNSFFPTSMTVKLYCLSLQTEGAGVAQSVQCLITDWTSRVRSLAEKRIFLPASVSRLALGPIQPIKLVMGVLSLGVKHSWGVTLNINPSSAKVKN
jgi:hypothetical protein